MKTIPHQYIDRDSGEVRTETLFGDRFVNLLYSAAREDGNMLMRALASKRMTDLAALLRFDLALDRRPGGIRRTARNLGIDFSECVDTPDALDTPRKLFERRIRYWDCRPMPDDPRGMVSPADARVLVGSLRQASQLWIKEKFFTFNELLEFRAPWVHAFHEGDFAVFRLTPDKYHYNHAPVNGIVRDCYEIPGGFHACNPGEEYQFIAAVPVAKTESDDWTGRNLTYYGFIVAWSYALAILLFLLLMAAVDVPATHSWLLIAATLAICFPASRIVARIVENKPNTLTVGGASFVGMILLPWIFYFFHGAASLFGYSPLPVMPALAALAALAALVIAYGFGEGVGRLACVSFGCCYGKPLADCNPLLRKLFQRMPFFFHGHTKKIAYASNLEGEAVLPIQAVTAVIHAVAGMIGIYLFLNGHFKAAFLAVLTVTQLWRCISEFFRADYRGDQRLLSGYQVMALISVAYAFPVSAVIPSGSGLKPDILEGMIGLWTAGNLLAVQLVWAFIFHQTGLSMVTGSRLFFFVKQDLI